MNPEQARAELARRELARRQSQTVDIESQRQAIKSEGQRAAREMLNTDPMARGMAKTPQMIEERGSLYPTIGENLQSPNWLRKGIGVAQAAGAPFKSIEGAVANPMIAFQRGENNPITLAKEAGKGFIGTKQGEFGDLYRNVGTPEPVAATAGFGLGIGVPTKILGGISKSLRPISKMSDKGLRSAGLNLKSAIKEAENFTGTELNKQFGKLNQLPVDQTRFIDDTAKIPPRVLKHIEEKLGEQIQNMAPTVENLRRVKQMLGRISSKAFGKGEGGLDETLDEEMVTRAYGLLKKHLKDAVSKNTDAKTAQKLMDAEEAYSKVSGAGNVIQKAITSRELRMPTKAGKVAEGLKKEGDFTVRESLNILRGAGKQSKSKIDKAIKSLEHFNRMQSIFGTLKKGVGAATYGGAVGAAGGMVASRLLNRRGGSDG